MQMEHARNLNNELYCHRLFWGLNCIFVLIISITVLVLDFFPNDVFDYIFMLVEFIGSVIAITMMFMTRPKKRILIPSRQSSLEKGDVVGLSYKDKPIRVYLNLSFGTDDYIKFRIETELMCEEIKRKFSEFLDLESYLLEYIQRILPDRVNEVPIIDKFEIKSSQSITEAIERRYKSLEHFLEVISTKREFWDREVLDFLGIQREEHQVNFLAQHDRFIQLHQKTVVERDNGEISQVVNYKQNAPFNRWSKEVVDDHPKERRATYYSESPHIIPNYNLLANGDDVEPNRKMLKVTVSERKNFHDELEYALAVDYFEGK